MVNTTDMMFCPECGALLPMGGNAFEFSAEVKCDRCGYAVPVVLFEGVKKVTHSREFAFQAPKFDTRSDEVGPRKGAQVQRPPPL